MTLDPGEDAPSLQAILHPTDFGKTSDLAFAHALAIALAVKGRLEILHTEKADPGGVDWTAFPGVRATLVRWGLIEAGTRPEEVALRLGVRIRKVDLVARDPVRGIATFAEEHAAGLLVLATAARAGLARLRHGSVALPLARRTLLPTLFLPDGCRGFIAAEDGAVTLRRILVPIAHDPRPGGAIALADSLARALGAGEARLTLLHVGEAAGAPPVHLAPALEARVERSTREGAVVDTILAVAREQGADLIAMATKGHQGFLDALRGDTTEQVLRRAGQPVLAVPWSAAP